MRFACQKGEAHARALRIEAIEAHASRPSLRAAAGEASILAVHA